MKNLLKIWPSLKEGTQFILKGSKSEFDPAVLLKSIDWAIAQLDSDSPMCNAPDCEVCKDLKMLRQLKLKESQRR